MKTKNRCAYCAGHGLSKFWADKGIKTGDGGWMPIRWVQTTASPNGYRCDRCNKPEHLEKCPHPFR